MRIITLILAFSASLAFAQEDERIIPEPVSKSASIKIGGSDINYTVKAGYLTLKSENGEEKADVFFVAYTKDASKGNSNRPVTFSFNGGPGSSSVWLHLGLLGPKKVILDEEGNPPPPPYGLEDNPWSWLDLTDMVFIDPVSTGYSRATDPEKAKDYHGYSQDIQSVGEFIRRYLSDNDRWSSPKYIIGESYGTTRAAGLSQHLIDRHGIYLNGVILVSAITNFGTARFDMGNDLPYPLFLPTYAATAWYHKQLDQKYQSMELESFLDEVESFALSEYMLALTKGDLLGKSERDKVINKLHDYTSLSKIWLDRANLRIIIHHFTKELMRESMTVVGRFDSRYTDIDIEANDQWSSKDPSWKPTIDGPFSTAINDYLTRDLGFETHLPYEVLTGRVHPWDYGNAQNEYLNTSKNLARAMVLNPEMKVWIANGIYDLATPYFASEYTIHHMGLSPDRKNNIQMTYYPAGHMMYLQQASLAKMKEEASTFYK